MPIKIIKVNGIAGSAREFVCYCGRAWAGWLQSPWYNPYRVERGQTVEDCLRKFREYASAQPLEWWQGLWDACKYGELPLGCWCITTETPGTDPLACHCQILIDGLEERLDESLLVAANPETNRPTRRGGK